MKQVLVILLWAACAVSAAPPEVVEWIRANAVKVKTAEAGNGFEDLQKLKKMIGPARIVALGEATHGTHEFFQMKHRMLEFLAEEMGFTVFGIEANWPESLALNEYVLEGKGDPAAGLRGMYFWTWDTAEVLEMIQWMRRYNENPKHTKKLKFLGFDMQTAKVAARRVREYLQELDGEFMGPMVPLFGAFESDERTPLKKDAAELPGKLIARLDELKDQFTANTNAAQWAEMRQCAVLLRQYAELRQDQNRSFEVRDRSMAENVRWILQQEGPEAKMVLWAHNGHVSHAKGSVAGANSMGFHLREAYHDDYFAFGFSFNQGSFQAIEMPVAKERRLRHFTVKPAAEGSLDHALASAGIPLFVLDLRQVSGAVQAWFAMPHKAWSIGAGFREGAAAQFQYDFRILQDFDALIFVESTTPARSHRKDLLRP